MGTTTKVNRLALTDTTIGLLLSCVALIVGCRCFFGCKKVRERGLGTKTLPILTSPVMRLLQTVTRTTAEDLLVTGTITEIVTDATGNGSGKRQRDAVASRTEIAAEITAVVATGTNPVMANAPVNPSVMSVGPSTVVVSKAVPVGEARVAVVLAAQTRPRARRLRLATPLVGPVEAQALKSAFPKTNMRTAKQTEKCRTNRKLKRFGRRTTLQRTSTNQRWIIRAAVTRTKSEP